MAILESGAAYNIDTDGDGIMDQHEVDVLGSNPNEPDTDFDGVTDDLEYVAGTDPNSAVSRFELDSIDVSVLGAEVAFSTVSGRLYDVYYADSLSNTWTLLEGNVLGTGTNAVVVDPAAGNARFYQVTVADLLSGIMIREVWTNIGISVEELIADPRFPDNPTYTLTPDDLQLPPEDVFENFGQRLYGYLEPSVSGVYTFWISAQRRGELWLSTDDDPAHKVMICSSATADYGVWNDSASQQSEPQALVAGQRYYIEALHADNTGDESVSVAWQLNGSNSPALIAATDFNNAGTPVAVDDAYTTTKNTSLNEAVPGVLGNDPVGIGHAGLSAQLVVNASAGTLSLQADGSFLYQPATGFIGRDAFSYHAKDGVVLSVVPASVLITVNEVGNNAPTAVTDSYDVGINDSFEAPTSVLANDSDDSVSYLAALISGPSNGQLELRADGTFSYQPNIDYTGTDHFTYVVYDGILTSAETTVTLNVDVRPTGLATLRYYGDIEGSDVLDLTSAPNYPDSPSWGSYLDKTAVDFLSDDANYGVVISGYIHPPTTGSYTFYAAGWRRYELHLSTDDNPANTSLIIADAFDRVPVASSPVSLTAGQRYYFKALVKENTTSDEFFRVLWSGPGMVQQIISTDYISHEPLVPVAVADTYEVVSNRTFTVLGAEGVVANDHVFQWRVDEQDLASPVLAKLASGVGNGSLVFNGDGSFGYTPNAGFSGTDSFTYSLEAIGDFLRYSQGGLSYSSTPMTVTLNVSTPTQDSALTNGVYAYYPFNGDANDYSGNVRHGVPTDVTYVTGKNGQAAEFDNRNDYITFGLADLASPWTLSMWVRRTADTANAQSRLLVGTNTEIKMEQLVTKQLGVSVTTDVTTDESYGFVPPIGDWVQLTFMSDYHGTTQTPFYHLYIDGTYFGWLSAGDLPLTTLGNNGRCPFMDVDEMIVWNRLLSYEEIGQIYARGHAGLSYTDLGSFANFSGPTAEPDRYNVATASLLNGSSVLANDSDPEGASITAQLVAAPANAVNFSLSSDGTFTYTSVGGFIGADSFTYQAFDGELVSRIVDVSIDVIDSTAPGRGLKREVWLGIPGHQVADFTIDPDYPDTPDISTYITNGFEIALIDVYEEFGEKLSGYIHPPVSTYYTVETEAVSTCELWLSTDDDPANLIKIAIDDGNESEAIRLKAGQRYYVELLHKANTNTEYAWVKWRMLGRGDVTNATIIANEYLSPAGGNSAPVVSDRTFGVFAGETFSLPVPGVLAEAIDMESDALSASVVTDVTDGSLTLNADGSFSYTPDGGFTGTDSFTFKVDDGATDSAQATVTLNVVNAHPDAVQSAWSFGGSDAVELVEVAPLSGLYACANRSEGLIEVRDFRKDLLYSITAEDIAAVLPGFEQTGSDYGIASISFSASGRLLFIGVIPNPATSFEPNGKDAILRYNFNTGKMTVFTRLNLADDLGNGENLGLLHYNGELYVGTDNGVLLYDAPRDMAMNNAVKHHFEITSGSTWVNSLTLDMYGEQVYLTTPEALYRLDAYVPHYLTGGYVEAGVPVHVAYTPVPPKPLQQIATAGTNAFHDVSMVRTFGDSTDYDLFVQARVDDTQSKLYRVGGPELRTLGSGVGLSGYTTISGDLKGICGTPDGRILLGLASPQMLADSSDTRPDITGWAEAYTKHKIAQLKSWIRPDLPGVFHTRRSTAEWNAPFANGWRENGGPDDCQRLLIADYLFNDPDVEAITEEAMTHWAGEETFKFEQSPDGILGKFPSSSDGAAPSFNPNETWQGFGSIIACYQYFKDSNTNITRAAETCLEQSYRFADYLLIPQGWTKDTYIWGPRWSKFNNMTGENTALLLVASAFDPLARKRFEEYTLDRNSLRTSSSLTYVPNQQWPQLVNGPGEGILRFLYSRHFGHTWRNSEHFYKHESWQKEARNIAFQGCAWSDDHKVPYLYAFNNCYRESSGLPFDTAAQTQEEGLTSDPDLAPYEMTNLDGVMNYCSTGDTWPALTCYLAYREGRQVRRYPRVGWNNIAYPNEVLPPFTRINPDMQSREFPDEWGVPVAAEIYQKGSLRDSGMLPSIVRTNVTGTLNNGLVDVDFWRPMHHRVLGSNDGTNWSSYGFQRAPFALEDGLSYTYYDAVMPEGQDMRSIMTNESFEAGDLSNWTSSGSNYVFATRSAARTGLAGDWAQIKTDSGLAPASEGSLLQTVDLAGDFDGSAYIVRGNGYLQDLAATGRGFLRVAWDNDTDPGNGTQTPQISSYLNSTTPILEFRVDTTKPVGYDYLHLSFVVEGNQELGRYQFDNLSLVRTGAPVETFFESANLSQWTETDPEGMIAVTSDPADVMDGSYAVKITTTPEQANLTGQLKWELDISGDPIGTRYVGRLKVDSKTLESTDIKLMSSFWDATSSSEIFYDWDNNDVPGAHVWVEPHFDEAYGDLIFTIRKCTPSSNDNYTKITLYLDVMRLQLSTDAIDTVILDDLEITKESTFPINPLFRPANWTTWTPDL